jgi:hypothetical protein
MNIPAPQAAFLDHGSHATFQVMQNLILVFPDRENVVWIPGGFKTLPVAEDKKQ